MKKANLLLGKFICWITGSHREPHTVVKRGAYEIEFCNRCAHIFRCEKVRKTFSEIVNDVFRESGNQVW